MFSKITGAISLISRVVSIIVGIYLFFVLGWSIFTRTPILEIEWFDSQWWILLYVVNLGLKSLSDVSK
jgi:hypothetical protein